MSSTQTDIPTQPAPEALPIPAIPLEDPAAASKSRRRGFWGRLLNWLLWIELILLLAMVQILFADYSMGVGNQSIQIAFLKKAMDPTLFQGDAMVDQTLQAYPSFFFRILGKILGGLDAMSKSGGQRWFDPVVSAYFWLHVLTTGATLATAYALGRAMFKSRASAVVLTLLLLAGHHRALGGDEMYSHGFTHTWAVFPLAIGAMALFYRGHHWLAFAIVGAIFNLHALTAGYLFVMFMAWAVLDFGRPGWWRDILFWVILFALLASPTALEMLRQGGVKEYGTQWLIRMRTRSADHSFPFTWWTSGSTEIARFVLLMGLAAASFTFSTDRARSRKTLLLSAGCVGMFILGTLFTEVWPIPSVIRAQFFRASRLLLVLGLAHIAHGVASGWRLAVGDHLRGAGVKEPADWPTRIIEGLLATAMFLCVAVPGMLALGFWVLLAAVIVGMINGRLSGGQATVACLALLVVVVASETIAFSIPGIGRFSALKDFLWHQPISRVLWAMLPLGACAGLSLLIAVAMRFPGRATLATVIAIPMMAFVVWLTLIDLGGHIDWPWAAHLRALLLGAGAENTFSFSKAFADRLAKPAYVGGFALFAAASLAAITYALLRVNQTLPRVLGLIAVHFACVILALHAYRHLSGNGASKHDEWIQAQLWAAKYTPAQNTLFLTPPGQSGFRIHSGRAIVGEWRDGTQLYFKADFVKAWWPRMSALRPAVYDEDGDEISRGISVEQMTDKQILALARQFKATHVILPTPPAGKSRELYEKYVNNRWTIYEARIPSAQDIFIDTIALPNIEKNRKSDARLKLVDDQGKSVSAGDFQITQTKQAFLFGCSLPPFEGLVQTEEQKKSWPEWVAPPVTEKQLAYFKEVFNFSMIPFSGKWNAIEPVEGQRNLQELDKYVDWCAKNGIEMEFHYLSGFVPQWARKLTPEQRKAAWFKHCRELVDRYHDRIKYWQVTNDKYLFEWVPEISAEIRQKYPDLKLGISDCAKFHSPFTADRPPYITAEAEADMMGKWGLAEIESLQSQKAPLDFFCTHGHKPLGCWVDMELVYECLDRYAKYGIKVHVTEVTVNLAMQMLGTREGQGQWTPELQAEFFEQFYTTLFSHPAVEAVNYWDLSNSVPRNYYGGRGGGRPPFGSRNTPPAATQPAVGEAGLLNPKDDEPRLGYLRLKELIRKRWMTNLSGKLDDDDVSFRGFHGDYEITVKNNGRTLTGKFKIVPGDKNEHQVKLTAN